MGRSIGTSRVVRGEQGYVYEYVPKEQPPNLFYLSAVSGAGVSFVEPELLGLLANEDAGVVWNCITLGRELLLEGKAKKQGELGSLLRQLEKDYLLASETSLSMAAVESTMAENIVAILERIDGLVKAPLLDLMLVGTVGYELSRADWPKMFSFVNESLPRPRQLEWAAFEAAALGAEGDALERQTHSLRGKIDYLPAMGLSILVHAVKVGAEKVRLRENEPELFSEGIWETVREWHGFGDEGKAPRGRDADFAAALVAHFAGRNRDARKAFSACKKAGDTRAERYLNMLVRSAS